MPGDLFWEHIVKRVVSYWLRHRHWRVPACVGLHVLRETLLRRDDVVEVENDGYALAVRTTGRRRVYVGLDYFLLDLAGDLAVADGLAAKANFGMTGERTVCVPFLDQRMGPPHCAQVSCAHVMRLVDFLKAHLEDELCLEVEALRRRLETAAGDGRTVTLEEEASSYRFVLQPHGHLLFVLYVYERHVEAFLPPLLWKGPMSVEIESEIGRSPSACTKNMLEELCENCYEHAIRIFDFLA